MLAGEALPAGVALVDGVRAPGAGGGQCRRRFDWWVGAAPVGCLSTRVAAVALVGPAGQHGAAVEASGRCHVAVTRRALRVLGVLRH